MKSAPVPHAITRALERYGLKLSYDDLLDMCNQCMMGSGRLGYMGDGKERHLVTVHGVALVVVYVPYNGETVFQRTGRIITILPKEAATPLGRLATYRKRRLSPPKKMPKKARKSNKWRS